MKLVAHCRKRAVKPSTLLKKSRMNITQLNMLFDDLVWAANMLSLDMSPGYEYYLNAAEILKQNYNGYLIVPINKLPFIEAFIMAMFNDKEYYEYNNLDDSKIFIANTFLKLLRKDYMGSHRIFRTLMNTPYLPVVTAT